MYYFSKASAKLAILAGLSLMTLHPAHAQNLVQDGDFEAPNPLTAGWTVPTGVATLDTDNQYVFAGHRSLYLNAGPTGTFTTVLQTLATTPGASYTLSFYADDTSNSPLTVGFGSTAIGPLLITQNGFPNSGGSGSNASEFTFYSYTVSTQTALTPLEFSAPHNGSVDGIEIDNISVVPAAVPEASTVVSLGLMLTLGVLAAICRRQRNAV